MADDIGTLIASRLGGWSDLGALVGNRISPTRLAQGESLPAVVWSLFGGGPVNSASGPTGTVNRELRVTSIGRTYAEAKQVAAAVEGALSGWSDETATPSLSPVLMIAERDEDDLVPDGSDQPVQLVIQDYSLWFQ